MNELCQQIATVLKTTPDHTAALESALRLVLTHFNSETGTIHSLDREKQLLHLQAQVGLPPAMLDFVRVIPVGKGIAGQVIARGEPVTMCNLQTDTSGVARPSAKQTGVGGTLCVPLRNDTTIVGTLGVGTVREYQYTPEETKLLEQIGELLGATTAAKP
jgi:GAF domain-containing protein